MAQRSDQYNQRPSLYIKGVFSVLGCLARALVHPPRTCQAKYCILSGLCRTGTGYTCTERRVRTMSSLVGLRAPPLEALLLPPDGSAGPVDEAAWMGWNLVA